MALALLFSGQGTQHPAMLPWLRADHPLLQDMQQRLAIADWRIALNDPDWASANAHAQVLLTATSLAAWHQLCESGRVPQPIVVAGYSVGEMAACCVAGMFDAAKALHLVQQRAAAMDEAAAGRAFGMLAISGMALGSIDSLCRVTGNALAIRNGPDSAVCAGPRECLDTLHKQAQDAGAHCTPLAVRIASHTHWMEPAARQFEVELAKAEIHAPTLAWSSNTGQSVWSVRDGATARQALAQQIKSTVQWDACMEAVYERQPNLVLEIGPGRSLATRWSRLWPDIPARSADEFHTEAALLRWVERGLG